MELSDDEEPTNSNIDKHSTTGIGSYTFGDRCIAPTLEEYLAPSGHLLYLPRPEWLARSDDRDIWKRSITSIRSEQSPSRVSDVPINVNLDYTRNNNDNNWAWHNGHLSDQSTFGGLAMPRLTTPQSQNPSRLFPQFEAPLPEENTAVSFARYMLFGQIYPNDVGQAVDIVENMNNVARRDTSSGSSIYTISSNEQCLEREVSCIDEVVVFGKDCNSALHVAIREGSTKAALSLIEMGTDPNVSNVKGVKPIILSSQRGNLKVTQALFRHGANLSVSSYNGTTALIQASHFGHADIVEFLLKHGARQNQANLKTTTALMRGSQEGHKAVVQVLLRYRADPNLSNKDDLTALMLAAQRGHVDVIEILLRYGAKLDVCTTQNSTALMLACKRGNLNVARVLVGRGCDLEVKDSRGRTAKDIAAKLDSKHLIDLISLDTQLFLMKQDVAVERNYVFVKLWTLLHSGRACFLSYRVDNNSCRQRLKINEMSAGDEIPCDVQAEVVLRTMLLPLSLVGHIAGYLCLPKLYEKRLEMMTRRCLLNPDSTIFCALDLIDDVLEEIGFVEACDAVSITAPSGFENWAEWKRCRRYGMKSNVCKDVRSSRLDRKWIAREHLSLKLKREACFLQILAHRTSLLSTKLSSAPYHVPDTILKKLRYNSDIASLTRRMGPNSVHFDASVASEIVQLAGALVLWHKATR